MPSLVFNNGILIDFCA